VSADSVPVRVSFAVRLQVCGLLIAGLLAAAPAWAQTAAGGAGHTIILKSDGTVWTVGLNSSGQLGDNSVTLRKSPIQVSGLSGVVAVAAGANHSMALTSTGALYVWGANGDGQVGDNSTTVRKTPVQSNLTDVVAIAAGEFHSVALKSNGDVYTWGENGKGQLGDGSTTQRLVPTLVVTSAAAIGAGFEHTLFVKTNGTVYGSGENSAGQLGDASTTDRSSPVQMSGISTATKTVGGESHSIVLLYDGTLKATGDNANGELGDTTTTNRTSPVSVSTLTNITAIAAGADHTIARESDSTVWAWGRSFAGQVGDGTNQERSTPTEVTSISSITKIGAGHDHSVAVTSSGVVYTWGDNTTNFRLGDGTDIDRWTPTPISDTDYGWKVSTPTLNIASGTYTTNRTVTIAATTAGATIRYTQNGNEPTGSDTSITSGSTVSVSYSQTLKAKAFKSGMPDSNTAAAIYEMQVATIAYSPTSGTYTSAQSVTMTSGTPSTTIRYTTDGSTPTESSTAYTAAVSVGTSTTLKAVGFKTDWSNSGVTTGTYTMNFGTASAPTADQATGNYTNSVTVTLSAQSGATIRYTVDGSTPTSGSSIYTAPLAFDVTTTLKAKAYHPDYVTSAETSRTYTLSASAPTFSPTAGTYIAGQEVTVTSPSVGSTVHYTLNGAEPTMSDPVIASAGTLVVGNYTLKAKAWKAGANASAVTTAAYAVTGEVAPPAIVAGDSYALAIRNDGVAWGWGANASGQTGDGTTTSPRLLPRIVSGLTGAMALSAGTNHSHVLTTGGSVVGFGGNSNGRLGDGTTTARLLPTGISTLSAVVSVDGGDAHGIALKGDGTALAWGDNSQGQVGDGTTTQRLSPTAVSTLTSLSGVAAGRDFSLAVKQDGTAWSWGDNGSGQLGDDSTTDRSAPVQVEDVTTATKLSAGDLHALALLADGTVMAWGRNVEGQLGDGTETQRNTPVEVALLSDVIAISAGGTFSMALKDDGTVWTWGANSSGQLGDGTTTERWSADQGLGLSNIVQIAAGDAFALALESDGSIWAWGANASGQLADGTTTSRYSPVKIADAGMSWRVATPVLSLASGQFFTNQSVTVTIADPDATLRYTTTGVDPTSSDATVTSGGSVTVDVSQTLKLSGWKTGAPTSVVVARTYELKAAMPTMTPGPGAYGSSQSVAIATTTSGATLRYTTDGTEPTASSAAYSTALTVADTQTVKARAYKTGWTASDSGYASYTLSAGTVATPTITPSGGTQTSPPLVSMTTATTGATLRYTLDGTTPTATSSVFFYPFLVPATTTVKAKAFKAGHTASAVASTTYDVDVSGAAATPLIVPAGGHYATTQTATITGASGATLRYTTDGTDPTTSSTTITSGNTVSVAKSQVLKVRAWASGLTDSAVRRADFMITGAVDAGGTHSMALTSAGAVYAWGTGGVIGDGNTTAELVPKEVVTGGAAISIGATHALVAKADGSVWGWGTAANGRLGNGNSSGNSYSPVQASSLTTAAAVAAGMSHSLVLKSDGTVVAFGKNDAGQLGDGTSTDRNTAVQVIGLSGIVAIAAGRDCSFALQSDGAGGGIVWAWGANSEGELGDGSQLARATPVRVTGIPVAISRIAAVDHGALAVGVDGKVYAWGRNESGQAGVGNSNMHLSAQPVAVLSSVRTIGTGGEHAIAVDATARSWAWGLTGGHLGFGVTFAANSTTPERSDLAGALLVSGGDAHSVAVMPDGTLRAFGSNQGQLGDGSTTVSSVPVTVSSLTLADNTWLTGDADADALATWREYYLGTDPLNADTNGNGILDGLDDDGGLSATNPDVDGDGVPNWVERANGTDPFRADTDGDTVSDSADAFPLDPTRSLAPSSNPSDTTPPVVTLKEPVSARLVP
jgi:alpha-tubulin suppressor-like RCC1 family protein